MGDFDRKSEQDLSVQRDHHDLVALFDLDKAARSERVAFSSAKGPSFRSIVSIALAFFIILASVAAFIYVNAALERRDYEFLLQAKADELALEEARRLRVEYAEIAFLDSLPPLAVISLDGKPLYAKTDEGSYTEFRARASSWLRNLPVKEDSVYAFSFSAEGFKPLTRRLAYYDWFPSQSDGHSLQKIFRRVVMEPDYSPCLSYCSALDEMACEWTVFREIMFREQYIELSKAQSVTEEEARRVSRAAILRLHPDWASAPEGSQAAQELLWAVEQRAKAPYALYGRIHLTSDSPDTRVFFMGEPLMLLTESGRSVQVRLNPGETYRFDSSGQGRPIDIGQKLSLRFESQGLSYVTELYPHQWRCTPVEADFAQSLEQPPFVDVQASPDLRHYLCDYSIAIDVAFEHVQTSFEVDQGLAPKPSFGQSERGAQE